MLSRALSNSQPAIQSYDQAIALNPNFAGRLEQSWQCSPWPSISRLSPLTNTAPVAAISSLLWPYPGDMGIPKLPKQNGIGGSEEAVIWLSRLLHDRGWNVTVYADCGNASRIYDGVPWKPHWMWNYRDRQDVTIVWRNPQILDQDINSGKIVLDLHDVIIESELPPARAEKLDIIFVKSQFHRSLHPSIPDSKFAIIPNGIDTTLFEVASVRNSNLIVNTSSADRSLEGFLDCYEAIKVQVPDAKAQWAYGWGIWDVVTNSDPQRTAWRTTMQARMRELGVAELGRLNHHDIAQLYLRANAFLYPTEMAEIDCISLSKAMAAGAVPVTTDFAALGEKSGHGGVFIHSTKTKNDWALSGQFHFEITNSTQKAEFVRRTVSLLRNPPSEAERESMRRWARTTFDWNTIADAWHQTLSALVPHHAGLESYDRAIQLNQNFVDAHVNRAYALLVLKQYGAALASFERAFELQPTFEHLPGMRLYLKRLLCDWPNIDGDLAHLEAAISRGEPAALPFVTLALVDSPGIQKQAAEIYTREKHSAVAIAADFRAPHDKIRIGYFSADFYNHATSYLIAELLERHDHDRFEIVGFSFGPNPDDDMGRRVAAAMDQFHDVRTSTDAEISALSRSLEIDIAIDLKGYTRDHRAGIFAHRAAPIQVSFLGYPGTMGAEFIDYLIADRTIIPNDLRQHYTEKVVCLPHSYQPNDSHRGIAPSQPTRATQRLPETGFVFCCFNNAYKITSATFTIWMRILARVDGSVLWLLEENAATSANLRAEAVRRGIDAERLIFAQPLPLADHLARHALADLFLDTTPYNAHTTASDALWAGLPLITCIGETFAGRVAASLLRAVNLPELVTTSEAAYERLAIDLAHDPARCQALRAHLQQVRHTAPLFDTVAFTQHLESAYTAIYQRHHAGLSPDHFNINPK